MTASTSHTPIDIPEGQVAGVLTAHLLDLAAANVTVAHLPARVGR